MTIWRASLTFRCWKKFFYFFPFTSGRIPYAKQMQSLNYSRRLPRGSLNNVPWETYFNLSYFLAIGNWPLPFIAAFFFFFLHQLLMEQKRHLGTFFHEISCYVSKEYYEDYVIKPVSPGGPDRSTPDRYTLGVFLFLVYYSYVHDRTLWFLFLVNDSYFQDHNLDSDIQDVPLVRWWCVFRL